MQTRNRWSYSNDFCSAVKHSTLQVISTKVFTHPLVYKFYLVVYKEGRR